MKNYLALVAIAALASACGDNSRACGEGTTEIDGYCVAEGIVGCGPGTIAGQDGVCGPICLDGTLPDPGGIGCVIDPEACQGGTILVDGECVDPAEAGIVDLEEGQEPNGLGVFGEASTAPAGTAALRAIGAGAYVIHGTIVPADHDGDGLVDGDIDTYAVTVTAPALLEVSADGVYGMAGAVLVRASVEAADPLAGYRRFALTTRGDTARRQLFLPRAGTYTLSVADTRTYLVAGSAVGGAAGAPAFEYYVSLVATAIPAAEPIVVDAVGGMVSDTFDGTTRFYSADLGTGMNRVELTGAGGTSSSLVNFTNQTFQQYAEGVTALLQFAEAPGDTSIVVAEPAFTFENTPIPFQLEIELATAVARGETATTRAFDLDVDNERTSN